MPNPFALFARLQVFLHIFQSTYRLAIQMVILWSLKYGHMAIFGHYGHIGAAVNQPKEYLCGVSTETYTHM